MAHQTRIMYIESKPDGVRGPARIGRVTYSKSGQSINYGGRNFVKLRGGRNATYYDEATGEQYWISGCKKDGTDALYSTTVDIDDDVREEYWTKVRAKPELIGVTALKIEGKYRK